VYSGIYYEKIRILKFINLIGEDKNTTIIEDNQTGSVIKIYKNSVNISGFYIRKYDCEIFDTGIGIFADFIKINNNILFIHMGGGIEIYSGNNNTITENEITSVGEAGVFLEKSNYNNISKNIISDGNSTGIELKSSSNNTISNNFISNQSYAIYLYGGERNNITKNTLINNNNCIVLEWSHYNFLSLNQNIGKFFNMIIGNIWICIHLKNCFHNTIVNNKIAFYKFGIFLKDSSVNKILENTFQNNVVNARFINGHNTWLGNFWSRRRVLPKPIYGIKKYYRILLSSVEFDWNPASEPYDIGV
jgi:parallel beta-helix repeat protein